MDLTDSLVGVGGSTGVTKVALEMMERRVKRVTLHDFSDYDSTIYIRRLADDDPNSCNVPVYSQQIFTVTKI